MMAPLFQAGRRQEALDEAYFDRIIRKGEAYLVHKLGAFGADLGPATSPDRNAAAPVRNTKSTPTLAGSI